MAANPVPISITVPPTSGGSMILPTVDYTVELGVLAVQIETQAALIKALTAQIAALDSALVLASTAALSMSGSIAAIEAYLLLVQTPTGYFKTTDLSGTVDKTLVSSALTKSGIPVPPPL